MRLAFVVQRYGIEVSGGAEALCRWVAERLQKYFEIDVLTTCAREYLTWENYYPPGKTTIHAVPVHRFPTDYPRSMKKFNLFAKALFAKSQRSLIDELTWIHLQGPYSSALFSYIKEHEEHYDLFMFVTYSYLTTFLGLQLVARKSLLIPAAHDEPHFHLTAFQPIFHLPRGIIYNTVEEKRLVQNRWHNEKVPCCIAGVGMSETTGNLSQADSNSGLPFSFEEPYLLYVGRVDIMKGCRELIHYFLWYLEKSQSDLHLVLLGKHAMDVPAHPRIHAPGFVSDIQKNAAIRKATLVVNPSEYESLSLLILEAWQEGIPVLVNGSSEVLVEHCLRSNGGLYYTNYEEFALCLDLLLSNQDLRGAMGKSGKQYVAEHYSWDTIEKTYVDFIIKMSDA